jgi:hypothetical protein
MTTDYPCSIKGSFLKKKKRMGRISRGGLDKAKEIGREKKKNWMRKASWIRRNYVLILPFSDDGKGDQFKSIYFVVQNVCF